MDRLARNEDLRRAIADDTDGRCEDIVYLPELIGHIIEQQKGRAAPGPQTQIFRLYDFTALFLLFVALLTVEWILRRNWQLQ